MKIIGHHSDDTKRRGIEIGNSICRIASESGYRNVALSSAIFAADGTAESQVAAIKSTFAEGRVLLQNWRDVTEKMFAGRPDLLVQLPDPNRLTIARLADHGWIMGDNCNAAKKMKVVPRVSHG